MPASDATFGANLPKAPKWATHSALTGGDANNPDDTATTATTNNNIYPSHRLMLPPQADMYLCNESAGLVDYTEPTANSDIFDPDTKLSGYENNYILVPRGQCTFESKVRSAQRLGSVGVIIRNTLESRYETKVVVDERTGAEEDILVWPQDQHDYECGNHATPNHYGVYSEIDVAALEYYPPIVPTATNTNGGEDLMNTKLLTGPGVDGNVCAEGMITDMSSFEKHCPSLRCLLTGRNTTTPSIDGETMKVEACCAWDELMPMNTHGDGEDDGDAIPENEEEEITIPSMFVTMENGQELYDLVIDAMLNSEGGGESVQFVSVVPYARWYPTGHISTILVMILGVFTVWAATYTSAKEYRDSWKEISLAVNDGVLVFAGVAATTSASSSAAAGGRSRRRADTDDTVDLDDEDTDLRLAAEVEMTESRSRNNGAAAATAGSLATTTDDTTFTISDEATEDEFVSNPTSPKNRGATSNNADSSMNNESSVEPPVGGETSATDAPSPQRNAQQQQPQQVNALTPSTPVAMRFMELNAFHVILFAAVASFFLFVLFLFDLNRVVRVVYGLAGSMAMTHLLLRPMLEKISSKYLGERTSNKLQSTAFGNLPGCRGKYYKWMDVVSSATGFAMGIAWIIVGFSYIQPLDNAYYWLIQDVMGVCFCIIILGFIHINKIMIATIFLTVVFIYDVFYVFLSPYIFGRSVMMDVALGGAYGVDATFCEKYPTDSSCRGVMAPLPMLLVRDVLVIYILAPCSSLCFTQAIPSFLNE